MDTWQGLPVNFDEVFTGWYRLGRRSASEFLGVTADITVYAKTLTGGLLPLALTVTKESIYDMFFSENKPDCLLHGHSYTAHPIGCSVVMTSIEKMDEMAVDKSGSWAPFRHEWKDSSIWSMWSPKTVDRLSKLGNVQRVMSLGSVLAVAVKDDKTAVSKFTKYAMASGTQFESDMSVHAILLFRLMRTGEFKNGLDGTTETGINFFVRPLGNIVYLMTSQITNQHGVRQCKQALLDALQKL